MKSILPYLRLVRFSNVLFIGVFQALLRWCVILPTLEQWNITPMMTNMEFAILTIATMALTASGNVINDYFDVRNDSINRPEKQVVDRYIARKTTLLIHVFLTFIGIFCGLYLAFAYRKETYALFFISISVVLWFYSTHFKKQMLIGNMVVALMIAMVGLLVVSAEISAIVASGNTDIIFSTACNQAWYYTAAFSFFAFICNLSREIIKDMEDIDGDMQCGCHTIPVELGTSNTKIIVVFLQIITMAVLWICYGLSTTMQQTQYLWIYLLVAITAPSLALITYIITAKESKDYHLCSTLSKAIMALGTMMMLLIYYF